MRKPLYVLIAVLSVAAIIALAGCTGTAVPPSGNNTTNGTGTMNQSNTTNGTGQGNQSIPNPASQYCVSNGGSLEIRSGPGGEYGVCSFPGGAQCEEWAYFRSECSPERPNFCVIDSDCACGTLESTGDCFYGQKGFVNTETQCPDFCTGIAGNLEIVCEGNRCRQDLSSRCREHTLDDCPQDCVVCPPCPECSSVSCQSASSCESMGFNSTWWGEMNHS